MVIESISSISMYVCISICVYVCSVCEPVYVYVLVRMLIQHASFRIRCPGPNPNSSNKFMDFLISYLNFRLVWLYSTKIWGQVNSALFLKRLSDDFVNNLNNLLYFCVLQPQINMVSQDN